MGVRMRVRIGRGCLLALSAFAVLGPGAGVAGASDATRYSFAGGCWSLAPADGGLPLTGATQLRFQATDLGSYLLYGTAEDFLAANGAALAQDPAPSPDADWQVARADAGGFTFSPKSDSSKVLADDGNGGVILADAQTAGDAARLEPVAADGCASYPEAELGATGTPATGKTPYGEVRGLLDGHMHWMTFEYLGGNFHCGKPWDRYGIPSALPDCSSIEGPEGVAAPVQNFLNYGNPVSPHDTTGWPKFTEWGRDNLTYEGTYWRWVERAWMAGLRLIVMPVNENRVLCTLIANKRNPCDEMNTVHLGIDDIYEMQDYVDAQAGGPGKGWFQIVRNPFQARKVINRGKMAVVLEVEVSELFNCKGSAPASCNEQVVDDGLDDLYDRGVRSSLLLNKFDNPLTGVRFDGGPVGALINAANKESYGSFWDAETCQAPEHDNTIETFEPQSNAFLASLITLLGVPGGTVPTYPPAPHCNTRGLTDLGAHTVEDMMDKGMIVNPDHMSQKGVDATISLAEDRGYSGVISPHGWMDPRNWPRIWQLGGMAFPGAGGAEGFVDAWNTYRPEATPYYLGWGYGADLGGLAHQGAPVAQGSPNSVTYPFHSLAGDVTLDKQVTGERTFDYSQEGVSHYGLYADWYEELRKTGGEPIVRDMLRGPEAYLQMWERAVGVPSSRCMSAHRHFSRRGLGRLVLGQRSKRILTHAGQPIHRTQTWSWCVKGKRGANASQAVVMTPRGKAALVASSARGQELFGVAPGDSASTLDGADRLGPHVFTRQLDKHHTLAYSVGGGEVKAVALAGPKAAESDHTLRSYLTKLPAKGVEARPDTVVTAASSKVSPGEAVPLVAQDGGGQFPYFCGL